MSHRFRMNTPRKRLVGLGSALGAVVISATAMAQTVPATELSGFHARTLGQSLLSMAIFALCGCLLALLSYKIFDWCTPGDLHKEILEQRNLPAAILGAAIILGVCLIVAASIMG